MYKDNERIKKYLGKCGIFRKTKFGGHPDRQGRIEYTDPEKKTSDITFSFSIYKYSLKLI